jgi:predicted dehydrogenase
LDTYHGSSYFQRWNRLREVSGGLSIHKACHHFDLIHWWIGHKAMEVFAYGGLNFYGPQGVHNPLKGKQIGDGRTCLSCDRRVQCKYYMRWNREEHRNGNAQVKLDEHVSAALKYEGYSPRQCIFDPQINIEDTYVAVIKYDGGAVLNYSLNGSMPYEGFRLGINGTQGRLDYTEFHAPNRLPFPDPGQQPVVYTPMFGGREQIDVINLGGGHGGGDPLLQDDLFIGPDPTSLVQRIAGLQDGIEVVMTGIAVHQSANQHKVINVDAMRKRVFGNSTTTS